jgi:hypothetical protein
MLSKKKAEKKLREISILKQKINNSREEEEKIQKEQYYKNILQRTLYLPEEIQRYIFEYTDTNIRLKILRMKYTPNFVNKKLSLFPKDKLTIKRLYSCVKYIEDTIIRYNSDYAWYIQYNLDWFLQKPHPNNPNYYINTLISIITTGIKHYSKIYKQEKNIKIIQKNESNMLILFAKISSW